MGESYVPIFYDWIEATQELNAQEKGRLIDAIVLYARGGDWQEQIKGNERYAFPVFRLQVDRARKISDIRANARANKIEQKEQTTSNGIKTEQKEQTATKSLTNTNTNTSTNTSTNIKECDKRAARFSPPTADMVNEYCREHGYNVDGQRFVDFYASKGWKVGNTPMKDWKAAVRTWVTRDKQSAAAKVTPVNPALDYDQREYKDEDFGDDFFINLDEYAAGGST